MERSFSYNYHNYKVLDLHVWTLDPVYLYQQHRAWLCVITVVSQASAHSPAVIVNVHVALFKVSLASTYSRLVPMYHYSRDQCSSLHTNVCPRKYPCRPKSWVMFKHSWALLWDTTVMIIIVCLFARFILCATGSLGVLGDQLTLFNLWNLVLQDTSSETLIWYSRVWNTTGRWLLATP